MAEQLALKAGTVSAAQMLFATLPMGLYVKPFTSVFCFFLAGTTLLVPYVDSQNSS